MSFLFLSVSQGLMIALLLTCTARAGDPPTPPPPGTPGAGKTQTSESTTFIKVAMQANASEVALAQLAEQKSQNADVKQFAAMVEKDHKQANEKLRSIAQSHGIVVDQTPDAKQQHKLERFQQMSGSEFDKEFAKTMLQDHQKSINRYEKAEQIVSDPAVKQYVQTTLPKLREHLQHAKHTAQAVGVDAATISAILKESSSGMGGTGDDSEMKSGSDIGTAPQGPTTPEKP